DLIPEEVEKVRSAEGGIVTAQLEHRRPTALPALHRAPPDMTGLSSMVSASRTTWSAVMSSSPRITRTVSGRMSSSRSTSFTRRPPATSTSRRGFRKMTFTGSLRASRCGLPLPSRLREPPRTLHVADLREMDPVVPLAGHGASVPPAAASRVSFVVSLPVAISASVRWSMISPTDQTSGLGFQSVWRWESPCTSLRTSARTAWSSFHRVSTGFGRLIEGPLAVYSRTLWLLRRREDHRAGRCRHAALRLERDGEDLHGLAALHRLHAVRRPPLGVDPEDARGPRRPLPDRPQLVRLARRRRRQVRDEELATRRLVPDQPPRRPGARAQAPERHHPRRRVAQQVRSAPVGGELVVQDGDPALQALTRRRELAGRLPEPRLVVPGDEGARERSGDDRCRSSAGDPRQGAAPPLAARRGRGRHRRDPREQRLLDLGRRHGGRRRARERRQRLVGLAQRDRAARTLLSEVSLELDEFLAVERAERVSRRERVEGLVVHVVGLTTSRSRSSASRMRVFTVPSVCLSRSAISVCVSPA